MKRRHMLLALGAGSASAQPPRVPQRVGVLGPDLSDASGPVWDEFVAELARRGFVEGRNLVFEKRFGRDDRTDLLAQAAAELVAAKVDLIYAARGTVSALAAKQATSTIPVVFYSSGDPVGLKVVDSLSRPGGNVTGNAVLVFETVRKGVEVLAEVKPDLRQFAFFRPPGTLGLPWLQRMEESLSAAAHRLALRAHFVEVQSLQEMPQRVARLVQQGVGAMLLFDFAFFRPQLESIAALFIRHRLPSYGGPHQGFLLSYGEPRLQVARSAAAYVERILRGAKPADLPVEQISTFELSINLKTARAIGLRIPPAVLVRATEVIE